MRRFSKDQIIFAWIVCVLLAVCPQAVFAQGGDNCSAPTVISALPYTDTGDTTSQTDDYDEICDYNTPGSPDVVYSYTPSSNVTVSIDVCNSAYDTKLYVYEGACGAYQSGTQIACNDDACGSDTFKSQLNSVDLTGGNTYYIVVDGYGGDLGAYEINVSEKIVIPADVCSSAIEFTSLPYTDTGTTVGMNDDYYEICDASATGAPDIVYSYTPSYSVAVSIDLCNSSYDTKVYVYEDTCGAPGSGTKIACNDDACGTDGSRSRIDYVVFTIGHTYYIVVDGYGNYAGDYELTVSQTGAITGACCDDTTGTCTNSVEQSTCTGRFSANTLCADLVPACGDLAGEDCTNATVVPSLPYTTVGITTGANNDYNEQCVPSSEVDEAPDVVYSYTPIANEVIDISLCNSEYFTKVYIYENTCGTPGSGTHIACDDGSCGGTPSTAEIIGLSLTAGNTYYIIVDGFGAMEGLYQLDITSSSATVGACCDDSTETCQDGIAQESCYGRFSANTLCSNIAPPCGSGPTLDCPANTLYGQPVHGPDDPWSGPVSEEVFGEYVYDSFTGVTGPICDIHWWGFQVDTMLEDCTDSDPSFDITFYADNAGQPGTAVCSYQVTPTMIPTGINYSFGDGPSNQLIYYSVDSLSPCCTLTDGWVSITGQGDEDCWFLWLTSGTGDGTYYDDLSGIVDGDLNLCLTGADDNDPNIRIEPLSLTDSCPSDPNEEFTIYNDGSATLNVTGISTPAWVLGISPALPYSIAPSGNQPVTVTLDCCKCAGRTQLQVTSDDADKSPYPNGVFVKLNVIDGDLSDDCEVDLEDFSEFAVHWHESSCSDPDWCGNADIDQSGDVDLEDLAGFVSDFTDYLPLVGCP
jgi:hypothetical protein